MPIRLLDQTMRVVTEGNEDARAPVLRNDEMGRLAQTFNSMLTERNAVKNQIYEENRMLQANVHDLLLVVADASEGALYGRAKVTEGALGNVCAALNQMLENFTEMSATTDAPPLVEG